MKTVRVIFACLFALMVNATTSLAEDVDIYSGLSGAVGKPNVLIVFDNSANFEADAGSTYCIINGVHNTLEGKAGGIEQCAFYNVIDTLPNDVINIGMMIYNSNLASDINGTACVGSDGGCLVVPLTTMNAATKAMLKNWIATWRVSGGGGSGYIKSATKRNAASMQEAWAYYAGGTGLSGRSYAGIKPTAGCQQNFVIFIGNAYASSSSPGDGGSASPASALASAPGVTAAQTALITTTHVTSCGTYTFPSSNHENGGYGADEWARYMRQHDLYSDITETQKITTYTIGLLGPSCQANYAALLTSMAHVGGGKYFATTDYDSIKQALLKILNEVQAVNSVFSSSSLPVSVNAQGTYENQVFMGMFRPDAGGYPRWLGNLKQYQFIYNVGTGVLSLGDSLGAAAISSAGTGFISPNAVSYWTCGGSPNVRSCSPVADASGGFWANSPQSAGGAYDLPDGELVEKGGAAQVMRLASMTADYTTTAGTSTNPRKLYTYCPSGSSCNATLSHSSNAFATTNAGITAAMFGGSSTVLISSIVRTGTSALVTTSGAHGYSTGNVVTISGATQSEYNVTQAITVNSTTTFTITGLPDYPTTPSAGAYAASLHGGGQQAISTITRSSSSTATGTNSETATVTMAAAHGYTTGDSVQVTGATPTDYNGIKTITVTSATTFTYTIPIYPTATAVNTYKAVIHPYSRTVSTINKSGSSGVVTTSAAHGFHVGQTVTISGTSNSYYNTSWAVVTVPSTTTFTVNITGNPANATGGSAAPSNTPVVLSGLTRIGTTVAATARATGATASAFANGDTVDITVNTGTAPNETAYVVSGALITCSGTCTTFDFPITATPATSATGTMEVALSAGTVTIPAGSITRSGTTATVTGVVNAFTTGQSIDISTSGTAYAHESAYTGTWTITCPVACSTAFTFGPVTVSPTTPATGAHITVYQGSTPPAKDPLINWVRGEDNFGDELSLCPPGTAAGINNCPATRVTVRPSLHGDVLHSRPLVINYGGTTGVVVFYGANDGVYRAVNGNQTNPSGSSLPAPGSELWGVILPEFLGKLDRQRTNSPQLLLPTTPTGILPAPLKKDYFVDGMTGAYKVLNADNTINTAYIYLTMRRGGRLIYALNVSVPTNPQFLWKIDPTGLTNTSGFTASTDFAELGQTWSAPKVTMVDGYANPVLIFGGGYDEAEDSEPPLANTMGRGIFIVDAITGALVWSATNQPSGTTACSGTATKAACLVAGMDYSIPADISLIDRDRNGKTDRLYAVDVGGNVWRVDLQPTPAHITPNYWQVNKLAALGCDTGVCAVGPPRITPRKFLYPVDVVASSGYDMVLLGQGDREHPLYTHASYAVSNRFYMLRDINVGNDGSGATLITPAKLFNTTSATYTTARPSTGDGTTPNLGYYIVLGAGEKLINAPTTIGGFTYFSTNKPAAPAANSCNTNLGIAKSYKMAPLTGDYEYTNVTGGGLPPSPVYGVVRVNVNGTAMLLPFIIGGAGAGDTTGIAANKSDSATSASGCTTDSTDPACGSTKSTGEEDTSGDTDKVYIPVPTSRKRTYWYQEID